MLTSFHFTGQQKYNGTVPMKSCIAVIPFFALTIYDNSRLNRAGFFMAATDARYIAAEQCVGVRVFD
jgi:hypothetical protein